VNLSIIQSIEAKGPADPTSHFGIQVKSTTAVGDMRQRLEAAGLATQVEESVNCCHAVQDKVWIVDPDGHRWEIFVVLDDTPTGRAESDSVPNISPCCGVTGLAVGMVFNITSQDQRSITGLSRINDPSSKS
jgi:hypothetical protein